MWWSQTHSLAACLLYPHPHPCLLPDSSRWWADQVVCVCIFKIGVKSHLFWPLRRTDIEMTVRCGEWRLYLWMSKLGSRIQFRLLFSLWWLLNCFPQQSPWPLNSSFLSPWALAFWDRHELEDFSILVVSCVWPSCRRQCVSPWYQTTTPLNITPFPHVSRQ